ncbi:unnamed protein product [Caenorhabditis auriculariae]|uniref:Uncharacterized protein n=1 Tax=Caenorhabditis auriculariae TaxID=2777116 RepID=A0A8S1HNB9_9PELO|nr:unnamed protein product [Caenorhabditis auriculariae]
MIGLVDICLLAAFVSSNDFELETGGALVECVQCVQLWRSASAKERQCKHCPVYQYMSGCVQMTPWQFSDLEMNRRHLELRMRRIGAVLLCEDTFNQTTCVCNRRDKCNSIHSRLPYTTYSEGLFKGVVNFDAVIGDLDPRYLEVMSGYHFRFTAANVSSSHDCLLPMFLLIVLVSSKLFHFT